MRASNKKSLISNAGMLKALENEVIWVKSLALCRFCKILYPCTICTCWVMLWTSPGSVSWNCNHNSFLEILKQPSTCLTKKDDVGSLNLLCCYVMFFTTLSVSFLGCEYDYPEMCDSALKDRKSSNSQRHIKWPVFMQTYTQQIKSIERSREDIK